MNMPLQKPGRSKQDYGTPPGFLVAAFARWGGPSIDLAARADNAVCPMYIGPEHDSLTVDWAYYLRCLGRESLGWLNPPYENIKDWAAKCAETRLGTQQKIMLLIPASVGSNWWGRSVHDVARVYFLSPRLTFVGCAQPYPKDCALCVYGEAPGYEFWRWK